MVRWVVGSPGDHVIVTAEVRRRARERRNGMSSDCSYTRPPYADIDSVLRRVDSRFGHLFTVERLHECQLTTNGFRHSRLLRTRRRRH